ncbi:hypothetical protein V5799_004216 [Amblyomma americanum]|uniref:Uncharacterized protein n=1 Tax=Amblyomma americanum TaxID=6943 RepID=A0AAQ4D6R6_AMBAM
MSDASLHRTVLQTWRCWAHLDIQATRVLQLLCKIINQPGAMNLLFIPLDAEEAVPCVTSCVAFSGGDLEQADDLFLYVEGRKLMRVIDTPVATTAIMAAFWLFIILYRNGVYNFLCIIEHLFLSVTISKPKLGAKRFIAMHRKDF